MSWIVKPGPTAPCTVFGPDAWPGVATTIARAAAVTASAMRNVRDMCSSLFGIDVLAVKDTEGRPVFPALGVGGLGGVAIGLEEVAVDQRVRQLPLSTHELEPVRFELVATSITLVQSLSLCDEGADRVVEAFDASSWRGPQDGGPAYRLQASSP